MLAQLPRYESIFSRMLAYSQDFIPLVMSIGGGGNDRARLGQHEGVRE
jgi:hypothetical protein